MSQWRVGHTTKVNKIVVLEDKQALQVAGLLMHKDVTKARMLKGKG